MNCARLLGNGGVGVIDSLDYAVGERTWYQICNYVIKGKERKGKERKGDFFAKKIRYFSMSALWDHIVVLSDIYAISFLLI